MSRFLQFRALFSRIVVGWLVLGLAGCAPAQATATHVPSHTPGLTRTTAPTPTSFAVPARIQADLPTPLSGQNWWQSPDGLWLVEDMNALPPSTKKDALRVVRVDGSVEWEVKVPGIALYPVHRPQAWSQDGNAVYIATSDLRPGEDPARAYCRMNSIRRLDLHNGSLETFLDFSPECWDAAFSPDGSLLAYVAPSKTVQQLVVLDLKNNQKLVYKFNSRYAKAGLIRWAPEQKQLLVAATRGDELTSSLVWIKVENQTLLDQEIFSLPGLIFPQEWQGDRVWISQSAGNFNKSAPYWEVSLSQKTVQAFGPTLTPTLTLTPTRTPRIAPSKTPGPNWATLLAPTETVPPIIQTAMPDRAPGDGWVHSPDGQWLAVDYDNIDFTKVFNLRIIRADGKVEWKVDFLGPNPYRMDRYHLAAWSYDGNFAYIAYSQVFRDGGMLQYCGPEGIRRLDLRDGSVTSFLELDGCWNYAFSADARKLAYVPPTSPKQLVVMDLVDLTTGKKLSYPFDKVYAGAGLLRWSPDQTQLVMVASQVDPTREVAAMMPPAKSTLFWVKIAGEELVVKEVFSQSDYLYLYEWNGNSVLVRQVDLARQDDLGPDEALYWEVDLSRRTAIPVQAVPTPRP